MKKGYHSLVVRFVNYREVCSVIGVLEGLPSYKIFYLIVFRGSKTCHCPILRSLYVLSFLKGLVVVQLSIRIRNFFYLD